MPDDHSEDVRKPLTVEDSEPSEVSAGFLDSVYVGLDEDDEDGDESGSGWMCTL